MSYLLQILFQSLLSYKFLTVFKNVENKENKAYAKILQVILQSQNKRSLILTFIVLMRHYLHSMNSWQHQSYILLSICLQKFFMNTYINFPIIRY
jgi:hypothetical protein